MMRHFFKELLYFGFSLITFMISGTRSLDNGLAKSPPMGWTTGMRFYCNVDCYNYPMDCISEKLIIAMADSLVELGLINVGYQYISIGDCWSELSRNQEGQLELNKQRFPSGIDYLVNYLKLHGLKLGLYLEAGNLTVNGYPGSLEHMEKDVQTLVSWGVEKITLDAKMIKDVEKLDDIFERVHTQINSTGKSILFNCYWPVYQIKHGINVNMSKVAKTCNMYRLLDDMQDSWDHEKMGMKQIIQYFGDKIPRDFKMFSGPYHWMEVNQINIGNYGLSEDQERIQMALWSILSSPLFIASDLRHIKDEQLKLLKNMDILGIDNSLNPIGYMHSKLKTNGQVRIWTRKIEPSGSYAILFTYDSISGGPAKISIKLSDLGLGYHISYKLIDVFSSQILGIYKPWFTFNGEINPNGAVFLVAKSMDVFTVSDL